jgi:hypothetical protein
MFFLGKVTTPKPNVQQKWRSFHIHEVLELKNRGPAYIIEAGDRWVDRLMPRMAL